jgi:hypothetical protein
LTQRFVPLFSSGWTPRLLGSSLFAWWDAERPDLITKDGSGFVSSWKDVTAGTDAAQAVGASQPQWSATGYNSRAAVTFDGVDDYLENTTGLASWPGGATPGEIWFVGSNNVTNGLTGIMAGYGAATNTGRLVQRSVSAIATRAGDGAANVTAGTGSPSSGNHVWRCGFAPTTIQTDTESTTSGTTAIVPNTNLVRFRMGSNITASPATFGIGPISAVLVTGALNSDQAALMYAYFTRRI